MKGIYWIVLKQEGGISIFDEDYVPRDEDQLPPQIELFEYFKTFRSPFNAYEAEDPKRREMDELFSLYQSLNKKAELSSITPTKYKVKSISVYAL